MFRLFRLFFCACCCLAMLMGQAYAKEKPAPPQGFDDILPHFSELEDAYEEEKWQEAIRIADDIFEQLKKVMPSLSKDVDKVQIVRLKENFINLKKSLRYKEIEFAEKAYIDFQLSYFTISLAYAYPVPPLLGHIRMDLEETEEAAEKGDFEDVVSEMTETEVFFELVGEYLAAKGVAEEDVERFVLAMHRVKKAGKRRRPEVVRDEVQVMQKLLDTFTQTVH